MADLPEGFLTRPLAHRALHDVSDGRPENSRAAISAAISAGYGIEIDIQRSADDVPVAFHDYHLGRLTGATGLVAEQPAKDLEQIRLTGGHEGIPTLGEVLEIVAGTVPLLVEIKDQDGAMGPRVGPLEHAVAAALRDYEGPVAVMSFNPYVVEKLAELVPDIPRGLVTSAQRDDDTDASENRRAELRQIPDYDRLACSFISHDRHDLDRPRVAELKARGAHILCWTVKSPVQEAEARKIAENITFEQYRPAFQA